MKKFDQMASVRFSVHSFSVSCVPIDKSALILIVSVKRISQRRLCLLCPFFLFFSKKIERAQSRTLPNVLFHTLQLSIFRTETRHLLQFQALDYFCRSNFRFFSAFALLYQFFFFFSFSSEADIKCLTDLWLIQSSIFHNLSYEILQFSRLQMLQPTAISDSRVFPSSLVNKHATVKV